MKKTILIIIVFLVVGGGVYWLVRDTDESDNQQTQTTTQPQNTPAEGIEQTDNTAEPAATIVYTDSGFAEREVRVPAGSTILIKNDSSSELQFSSDEHPVHSDNQELNAASIGPGQTTTITVRTPGTWGFHNHEAETHTGTLIVE